jgi:ankyrin repeat protein
MQTELHSKLEELFVNPDRTLADFVALLDAHPNDINVASQGWTPLTLCSALCLDDNECHDFVNELFIREADQFIASARGTLPFHRVTRRGFLKTVQLFISNNINCVNFPAHATPLHYAAIGSRGSTDDSYFRIAELLLEKGANPHALTTLGLKSTLHYVAEAGSLEITRLLLAHKVDPNLLNFVGGTAAHAAGSFKLLDELQLLGAGGTDLGIVNSFGFTAYGLYLSHLLFDDLEVAPDEKVSEVAEGKLRAIFETDLNGPGWEVRLVRLCVEVSDEEALQLFNKVKQQDTIKSLLYSKMMMNGKFTLFSVLVDFTIYLINKLIQLCKIKHKCFNCKCSNSDVYIFLRTTARKE